MNPELKVGERVRCVLMKDDELSVPPGTWGKVQKITQVGDTTHYQIEWENGSSLALLSDVDLWDTGKKHKLQEVDSRRLIKHLELTNFFNFRLIKSFFDALRESGIINMFGAAPFLYMGRDRIQNKFGSDVDYGDNENDGSFEKMLDLANEVQADMIHGVIEILNKEGKEESLENINRYLPKYSSKLLDVYIALKS